MACNCKKFIFVLINIIFLFGGLGILILGILPFIPLPASLSSSIAGTFAFMRFSFVSYVVIAIGSLVFLISLFGVIGGCRNVSCCLVIYFIIVLIFLLFEVGVVIAIFVSYSTFRSLLYTAVSSAIASNTALLELWLQVQTLFSCCGFNSVNDLNAGCPSPIPTIACWTKFENFVTTYLPAAGGALAGLGVLEIICLILSCLLRKKAAKRWR